MQTLLVEHVVVCIDQVLSALAGIVILCHVYSPYNVGMIIITVIICVLL